MTILMRKSVSIILLLVCMVISSALAGSAANINSPIYYETKLTDPLGAAANYFGSALDTDGDWAVVGAYGSGSQQGEALVYKHVDSGWVLQQYLYTETSEVMRYGYSVAISGNTIIVGAPYDSTSGNTRQGSAYVYQLNGDVWEFETKLFDSYGEVGDYFGYSVAIDGDTALIGVERGSPVFNGQGIVRVYNYTGGMWTYVQTLTSSHPQLAGHFGYAVALEGNKALVGAPDEMVGSNLSQGCVYVYINNGLQWIEQQRLTASDGEADDQFGSSVDLKGDTVISGAPMDSSTVGTWVGSAYVFTYNLYWIEQAKLVASDASQTGEYFGNSVSLFADSALIGAPGHPVGDNLYQGAAYIYGRNGTVWTEQAELTASDGMAYERFGSAVTLNGNEPWVGAPNANGPGGSAYGAVYIYTPLIKIMLPIILKSP